MLSLLPQQSLARETMLPELSGSAPFKINLERCFLSEFRKSAINVAIESQKKELAGVDCRYYLCVPFGRDIDSPTVARQLRMAVYQASEIRSYFAQLASFRLSKRGHFGWHHTFF